MLTWFELENAPGFVGFDDDCPLYYVRQDKEGWYWEDTWGFGEGGFETAEEAKAEAEKYASTLYDDDEKEASLSLAEEMEILGDILYEARRDDPKFF